VYRFLKSSRITKDGASIRVCTFLLDRPSPIDDPSQGVLGYISMDGTIDFSVVIRTIVAHGRGEIQARLSLFNNTLAQCVLRALCRWWRCDHLAFGSGARVGGSRGEGSVGIECLKCI
jgi:hypothetical protein